MLSPAALAIIMPTFHGSQRAKALAAWGAVGGAGAAIGVLLGGMLTEFVDWRLIFYVNLPVAAALAIAALKIIPADTRKPRWKGLDLRGAALATASLGAIVFAITQAEGAGWISVQTHRFGLGGLAGLAAFAALERRTAQPLLRIERLADRAVGGGLILMPRRGRPRSSGSSCSARSTSRTCSAGAAPDRPRLPSRSRSQPGAGAHAPVTSSARTASAAPSPERSWSPRPGCLARPRRRARQLPPRRAARNARGRLRARCRRRRGLDAILTGAREEGDRMISGLNSTGHEIGGTLGIAIFRRSRPAPGPRRSTGCRGNRTRSLQPSRLGGRRQPGRAGLLPEHATSCRSCG